MSPGVVLFGGADSQGTPFGDTWTWDGSSWTDANPSGPPARSSAAIASLGGKAVLFGGAGASGALDDTWTWDGASWSKLDVAGPSARDSAVMAPLGGTLVLFGGEVDSRLLGDTWTFDGAAWKQLAVPGPPARAWSAMAPLDGKLVLFGGFGPPTGGGAGAPLADMWIWDGTAWALLPVEGPSARWMSSMAPSQGDLLLFGGLGGVAGGGGGGSGSGSGGGGTTGDLADTWSWNASAWTLLDATGPSARDGAVMATLGGTVVVFGGAAGETALGDTWTFDGKAWAEASGPGPAARYSAAMTAL
jgi:N-acetylneuraminic acid mutarotase